MPARTSDPAPRSYVVQQLGDVRFVGALVTRYGDKTIHVAVTIGEICEGELVMSQLGMHAMFAAIPATVEELTVTELSEPVDLRHLVTLSLRECDDGDSVVFLCSSPAVWGQCFAALNVDIHSSIKHAKGV